MRPLLWLLIPLAAHGQTLIQDTIYTGFPPQVFQGRVTISGPSMTTQDGRVISRWTRDFQISDGGIKVELEPNDTATPPGTSYYVVYRPRSGMAWSEYWVVPTSSTPLSIGQVRVSQPPTPQMMVQLAQLASGGAQPGNCLLWDGSNWAPGVCGSGGGAVTSVFGRTGAVVAQQGDYALSQISGLQDALDSKVSTDQLNQWSGSTAITAVGSLASGSVPWSLLTAIPSAFPPSAHTHNGSDITSGTIDAARIPSLAGDVSGSVGATTVTKIQGREVSSTSPSNGQVLTWNNSASQWEPQTPSGGGTSVDFSTIHLYDEFLGSYGPPWGMLQWQEQSSGAARDLLPYTAGNAFGSFSLEPYVGANSYMAIHLGGYNMDARWFSTTGSSNWEFQFRVRTDPYETSQTIWRVGLADGYSVGAPSNAIWIKYANNTGCSQTGSDGTWIYETRSAGNSTTESSGLTMTAGAWYKFRIRQVSSGVVLFSGCTGPATCTYGPETAMSTNIPTAHLSPIVQSVTCVGGYRKVAIDRFEAIIHQ